MNSLILIHNKYHSNENRVNDNDNEINDLMDIEKKEEKNNINFNIYINNCINDNFKEKINNIFKSSFDKN